MESARCHAYNHRKSISQHPEIQALEYRKRFADATKASTAGSKSALPKSSPHPANESLDEPRDLLSTYPPPAISPPPHFDSRTLANTSFAAPTITIDEPVCRSERVAVGLNPTPPECMSRGEGSEMCVWNFQAKGYMMDGCPARMDERGLSCS